MFYAQEQFVLINKCINNSLNQKKGFTLVELLIAIVMFGILSTAGYSLFKEQSRINQTQQNILEMQSSARAAMQVLIQSFSHAGFGCSTNTSEYFSFSNNGFDTGDSDNATVTYGYKHVGTVDSNQNSTKTITLYAGNTITNNAYDINFFPSTAPNTAYTINSLGTDSVTVTEEIDFVPEGAKIFRIYPVEFKIQNNQLVQQDSTGAATIAFDVVNFQIAYSTSNTDTWHEAGNFDEAKAVWIYLLMRTREREPGFKETRTFSLPWKLSEKFPNSEIEDGYHYQEFQTKVWLRNAK